jgi:hypothetical protein
VRTLFHPTTREARTGRAAATRTQGEGWRGGASISASSRRIISDAGGIARLRCDILGPSRHENPMRKVWNTVLKGLVAVAAPEPHDLCRVRPRDDG